MCLLSMHRLNHLEEFFSAALCPDPPPIEHGTFTFTGNSVGDTATYICNPGFELIGSAMTICTLLGGNSAFLPDPPECRREYSYSTYTGLSFVCVAHFCQYIQ